MSPLKELLKRVEEAGDLNFWARRELEGEVHCALTGLPTCQERYGVRSQCANAWPAECQSEKDRFGDGTYRCGVGRIGGQKRVGESWEYVPGAPEYTKTEEDRRETSALLRALSNHEDRADG